MLEKSYLVDQVAGSTFTDNINLADIWHVLVSQSRKIFKFTGALLILAVLFICFTTPKFVSIGSFYTSGIKAPGAVNGNDLAGTNASTYLNYLSTFGAVTDIQTQSDIISSPALVQQAVLATGLNASLKGPGLYTPSYLIWKLFYGGSIGAFSPEQLNLTVAFANFSNPAQRIGKYRILFQEGGRYTVRQHGNTVLQGVLNQPASGGGLSLLLQFHDPSLAPAPGSVYKLVVTAPAITADALLKKGLTVTPGGSPTLPSEVINLNFRSTNPYQAQAFVNALMSEYIDKTVSWNSASASQMEDFITNQLNEVQAKLVAADKKLADYQQQTGVISPPDNAKDAIDQESAFESQRVELEIEIKSLQQSLAALDGPKGEVNPYLISQTPGTPISILSGSLATDLDTLQNLEARYTPDNPQVVALQAQIQQERLGIRSMLKNELASAQANLDGVNEQIAGYQKQIGGMPAQSLQVTELTNASTVLGDLYVLLMQKQQEAAISKTAAVSATQILMPAQLPYKSVAPKPTVILPMFFIVGLLGSSVWVLLRNGLKGGLNSAREIRELAKPGVFVTVPVASNDQPYLAKVQFEQSLYTLRMALLPSVADTQSKVILLTAASADEQKSMIAYNLAKVLAAGGSKVALVDADFHTGRLRTLIDVSSSKGLSNWIWRNEPVALQSPNNEKFAFLPAGTDEQMGMRPLSETGLTSLLSDLRAEYDFVVMDGPTPPRDADLLTLATRADSIVSVIQTGVSTRQSVVAQQNVLAPVNALHVVVALVSAV
jgi:uncharacterized protein involved in exopolysaccharide biosynthesis/Mrp family chromosome partitioning ATPase